MMHCQNCHTPIEYPLSANHLAFLKLFVSDPIQLEKYKSSEDIYENENSKVLSQSIFRAALSDKLLLEKIYELQKTDLAFVTVCSTCQKETTEQFWNWHKNNIYYELKDIRKDSVYEDLSNRTGLPKASLSAIYEEGNGDTSYVYLLELTLKRISPDLADEFKRIDQTIEFFHYNEKGGDGDGAIVAFILGYVASSIIPNLIYDSLKIGGKKLLFWIRTKIEARKARKSVTQSLEKYYPDYVDLYATESVLRHLSKRTRKKIIKKVIRSTVDAKTKEILISVRDKLKKEDAEH